MNELFRNVLSASFYGSIVIAAVLVLRLVLKKAPKKYVCLLWTLAGLRLLCPFEIESSFSLQPDVEQFSRVQTVIAETRESEMLPAMPVDTSVQADTPMPEDVLAESVEAFTPEVKKAETAAIEYDVIAAWIWMFGACALVVYSVFSYLRLKRMVREAVRIEKGVWECSGLDTAFVLGYFRPQIYLPMGLSEDSRQFILDHERMHMKRFDHWFKLLGFIALAVNWFNPLVWLSYILLCRDIEMACDESVVKNMALEERKAYSAALLRCSSSHRSIAACPVAFGEVSVKQRIVSVLNYRKKGFWFSLIAIIAVVFVAACFLTSPEEEEQDLSFLNYENAIPLASERDVFFAVHYVSEGESDSIGMGMVEGRTLAEYLDDADWAEKWFEPSDLSSPGSVAINLEDDYRITIYDRRFAAVEYGDDVRYYRIGWNDYQKAVDMLLPADEERLEQNAQRDLNSTFSNASEEELSQKCRAVLEEIQSRDYYYILEDRTFGGEDILNDSVCRNHFGSSNDWALIDYYDDVDESQQYLAHAGIGEEYYYGVSSELSFDWRETDPRDVAVVVPWLYSFDMDAQEIEAIFYQQTDEGYVIRLMVYGPSGVEGINSDSYYVDFYFDPNGSFRYAIQYVYGDDNESIITTMYAPEATEGQILSTMSKYAGDLVRRETDISLGTATVETEEPLGIYLGGEPDTSVETAAAPDWGITLETANATTSTVTLYITQSKDLAPQKLYYTNHYTLERWVNGSWTKLEPHTEFDFELLATLIPQNQTTQLEIDFTCFYLQQPAGKYRLCLDVTNYVPYKSGAGVDANGRPQEDTCCTYYAEFQIPGYSAQFADNELGALMQADGVAVTSVYLSTEEGRALLSREDEIADVLELLKNVRYDPEPTGETADPEDYSQNYRRIQFNNPYIPPYLQFDQNCETVWALSGDEVTAVYAVEDSEAVRELFERMLDSVKDESATASAFATRDEPWTWVKGLRLDAVQAVNVAARLRTRIDYNASSGHGYGGAMRTSRFEELLQILGSLKKDAFTPKEMEGGHSLSYWSYGQDVDWVTSVTIADGANHETVILRCLGNEMELIFCGDTGGVVEEDGDIELESVQCWTVEDETLLAYMQDLMYHDASFYYYLNPEDYASTD